MLPVFIPQIQIGQSDVNLTIYAITMTYPYQGITYKQTVNIEYSSLNPTYIPNPPTTVQDYSSPYYYVYSYQTFIDTVNKYLGICMTQLQAQLPSNDSFPANSPFMVFDPSKIGRASCRERVSSPV